MHKPFITYPDGAAGIGLLLLRLAVSATVAGIGSGMRLNVLWISIGVITVIFLAIGFMTRSAALVACALPLLSALTSDFAHIRAELAFVAQALALALLGPGVHSLDSRLFGRRLIFESRRPEDSE